MAEGMEQNMTHNGEIPLSRRMIVRALAATALFLLSASIAGQLAKYAFGQQPIDSTVCSMWTSKATSLLYSHQFS